jgi:hypothetical protein
VARRSSRIANRRSRITNTAESVRGVSMYLCLDLDLKAAIVLKELELASCISISIPICIYRSSLLFFIWFLILNLNFK